MRSTYWVLPLLALLTILSRCQGKEISSAAEKAAIEKVAAEAMEAVKTMKWKKYAAVMHPEALRAFRNMLMPSLQIVVKKEQEEQEDVLAFFDGAANLKTVMSWEPKQFFVSFLKGRVTKQPPLKDSLTNMESKILGTVREGKDLAHVVVRLQFMNIKVKGVAATNIGVVSLKRSGKEWRLLLTDDMRGVAEQFKRGLRKK
jgi:hypothetical protein